LFYFLLKTDEGVGWWLRRAGGRFPPSLIRYREIGFFLRDRLFLRGNFFFSDHRGAPMGAGEAEGRAEVEEEEKRRKVQDPQE